MLSRTPNILEFYDAEEFLNGSAEALGITARHFGLSQETLLNLIRMRDERPAIAVVSERAEAR